MLSAVEGNASIGLACGLPDEMVRTMGGMRLRVAGTSMVPSILPGDLLSIRAAQPREISIGEVIVFLQDGRLVVHRVVGRKGSATPAGIADEPSLITRGDRVRRDDFPVVAGALVGRVVSIDRAGRKIAMVPDKSNRPIARLLRASDRATSIYLRLAAYLRPILGRRAQCQA